MFPQIKPAHRRAEQSIGAHLRAPVIPTSFPAATAAASCPVPGMPLLFPELRGAGTLTYYLLAGRRQSATACSGGGGYQAITTDVVGNEWLQPASRSPAQRSGIACCAAVASLLMNAQRLRLKHGQNRNALPGGDGFVSIARVIVCPGQLVLGMGSLPNVCT